MTVRGYFLGADWSRQGVYTGTLEDLTAPGTGLVAKGASVTAEWGRSEGRATEDATASKLAFTVNNHDGQFSNENQTSPVAGLVLPGTPVKLAMTVAGATTALLAGVLDGIDDSDPRTVAFTAMDGWNRPGKTTLSTPVYSGLRTGDLIGIILDRIGWTGGRDIDPGATVVPYWWAEDDDATAAVDDLVHSEGPPAIAYVQAGTFVFRDRHHRLTRTRSTTSQAVWTHLKPAGSVSTANQLTNSTFEGGVSSWTAQNGSTRAQSSTWARTGSFSMRITPDGVTSGPYVESEQHACPAGFEWTASAWWFNGVAWPAGVAVNLEWYSASHGYLSVTQGTAVALPAGTPTQTTVKGRPPVGAAYVSMNVSVAGTPGSGILFYVDDTSLAVTPDVKILKGSWGYDNGLTNIINSASLEVTPRVPGDLSVVWSTTDPIALGPSEVRTLVVRADDPFVNAVVPDSTTTYPQDGDYTTDFHLASGAVTVTISRTSGQSLDLTLVGDPSLGAYLDTGISLRAVPLTSGATYKYANEDAASVSTFGRNTWQGSAPWAYLYDADVISQRIVGVYAQARPTYTVSIAGVDPNHLTEIAARTISDRVTIRNDDKGVLTEAMVERVSHEIRQLTPALHTLTVACQVAEPVQPATVFTFDVAGQGFDQGSFGTIGTSNAAKMFTFDTAGKGFNDGFFAA